MAGSSRRGLFIAVLTFIVIVLIFLSHVRDRPVDLTAAPITTKSGPTTSSSLQEQPDLYGHVIAPKLGNETLKAELGRAAWKLFHTTFARFPDKPTPDESLALKTYIHLFQRLYPCGECAAHFAKILEKYPPQVSSRSAAAAWGCHVHNQVNKRLGKEEFDCSNIGDFYDCGCAEDPKEKKEGGSKVETEKKREAQGG
jgi:FAD-linked sulfhydryl oxidase